jgi:predicted ATPase
MRLHVMFCRCNVRRSTSTRRLPRKSSGSCAATGIQESDDAELALAKLRSLLARAVTDVERALRYYGAVLSIPACSGYEPADLGSPSERERAFQVLIDVLLAASRKRPILGIVEDVQWIDPTTIELLVPHNSSLFQ